MSCRDLGRLLLSVPVSVWNMSVCAPETLEVAFEKPAVALVASPLSGAWQFFQFSISLLCLAAWCFSCSMAREGLSWLWLAIQIPPVAG